MNRLTILRTVFAAAMAVAIVAPNEARAEIGLGCLSDCGCICCPSCDNCCSLEAAVVDVEKKCFEVECKTICIPRVVFPWQTGKGCCCLFPWSKKSSCDTCTGCEGSGCESCNNCVHNGAKIRTIKVLKSKKYTCPECEYTWTPCVDLCDQCCDGCDGGCDTGCCDKGCASKDDTNLPESWKVKVAKVPSTKPAAAQEEKASVVPVQAVQVAPTGSFLR